MGYSSSKTLATLGKGNIEVGNTENSDDLSRLNRDTTTLNKDLYAGSIRTSVDATLDHRLLTKVGQKQIAEDFLVAKIIPEALQAVVRNDTVNITDFFKEVKKRNDTYEVVKEKIIQDPKLAEILNSPAYTQAQKDSIINGVTIEVLEELGYEPVKVKFIATTEPGREGKQVKGYYSVETGTMYINTLYSDTNYKLLSVSGAEAQRAMDAQEGSKFEQDDAYRAERSKYSEEFGSYLAGYTDFALQNSGQGSLSTGSNPSNIFTKNISENNVEFAKLDKTKGDNSFVPGAEYVRWVALRGKVPLKELTIQEIKQDERIGELVLQKVAISGKEAIEMAKNLPEVINFLYENPEELLKLPEAVSKAFKDYVEQVANNTSDIKDGLLTNNENAIEAQAQAESDLAADLTTTLIGAGVGKVAVFGGKVVVKSVGKTVEKVADKLVGVTKLSKVPKNDLSFNIIKENLHNLDVLTGKDTSIFYSGRGARDAAEKYAKENGKRTLELTSGGKWLDDLKLYKTQLNDISELNANNLWSQISSNYAKNASGTVHAIINNPRPNSVFLTSELPILLKNNNVNKIVIESVNGNKIEIPKNTKFDEAIKMVQGL